MAVIKNNRILKCLLTMVVSLLLARNFSIGVSASTNYDSQEADACITISGRLSVKGGRGSREVFLPTEKTHDLARKKLVKELDVTGAFKNGSQKYYGGLQSSYGYGKQIGTQSLDGKVRWRLDYDEKIGVHYNIEDFSKGKGVNVIKKVISIDISYDEYKSIIDSWN